VPEFFEVNFQEYRQYIDTEQHSKAIDAALELLSKRKRENPTQYSVDHKGWPFYVLGYAAFASHDYPSASLYFDAAVAADLRFHPGDLNKPSMRFMQLLHTEGEDLLARDIIAQTEKSAEEFLKDYCGRPDAQGITLDNLRDRFLRKQLSSVPERRALVTAFISFVAEQPYRAKQMELIEAGSREPFFLHLLRGCVLFESLLKAAPDTPPLRTLRPALRHHARQLGISVANIDTGETDFNNVPPLLSSNMKIEETINTCAKARNTLGHNLVWATTNLTPQTYDLLVKNIAASCLHAISKLYV
jgi:hypothetical protein